MLSYAERRAVLERARARMVGGRFASRDISGFLYASGFSHADALGSAGTLIRAALMAGKIAHCGGDARAYEYEPVGRTGALGTAEVV